MRRVMHAHRDGKYVAIDNGDAVVVDHATQMIRVGLDRWLITRPQVFRFMAFLLSNADVTQTRAEIGIAMNCPRLAASTLVSWIRGSQTIFAELGMVVETVYGAGYRLHTNPRETLECCRNIAPGQPLPLPLKSTPAAPGTLPTTCGSLRPRSTTRSRALSRAQ